MKLLVLRLALAALLACASAASQAHRFHFGITAIGFNARTGSVEVVHTYMAHDIEALLATLSKGQVDLTRPEDEALLRKYVEQRFYLLADGGARLPLKWIGMKASVNSVELYQELENTPLAAVARVHDEVLSDFLPRQSNTVNLTDEGAIRSLEFDAKTVERRIR
ncbi:MAG: DUF6702 family protein [Pseudomonadota bacterium]